MNGLGNEIVVLDLRGTSLVVSAAEARAIGCGSGLAFDQLMVLHDPHRSDSDAFMKIYNIDGSEAGACGNGTRCVAWTLMRDTDRKELTLETAAAVLACTRQSEWIFTVDMGAPHLAWNEIPLLDACPDTTEIELAAEDVAALPEALHAPRRFSAVNMGNPHAVFWVGAVESLDFRTIGAHYENLPLFPERANISFAQVLGREHVLLKVWERGVGATRACGSAACATLVAGARKGLLDRAARISLPGGDLHIQWCAGDDHVLMSGPVAIEFETELDPVLFQDIAA
jgi:diaminopimelate epimerase